MESLTSALALKPPSLPLVWVTVGKTQHAAYLIEEIKDERVCIVQWSTTHEMEQVRADLVEKSLSPRRRKSPERLSATFDSDRKRRRTKSFEDLGLPSGDLSSSFQDGDDRKPAAKTDVGYQRRAREALQSNAKPLVGFPLVSSAYLQNLSEIAHTISQDGRWRVGQSSESLLRWEDGSDLSALSYLRRYYIPPKREKRRAPCACLLCRDSANATPTVEPLKHGSSATSDADVLNALRETPDNEVRWLYLYCRLFYRRGPWFRLDDVYDRYYKPGGKADRIDGVDNDGKDERPPSPPVVLKENTKPAAVNRGKASSGSVKFDPDTMEASLQQFAILAKDLSLLKKVALIRSFRGEEECGKTVGVALVSSDMRAVILSKLGGGRKKPPGRPTSPKPDNQVWRQMTQQRSISASFSGEASKLLPVCKHVDDVILDKTARDILKASCHLDPSANLPAVIHKEHGRRLKEELRRILRDNELDHFTGFRLREEPTMALLRCCRLYVCATCGPGDMRSDGTNGWKSLQLNTGTPPLAKRIRRPGLDTWSFVSYPGMRRRFGMVSTVFEAAYAPIVLPDPGTASECQVFQNRHSFFGWENAVEVRANVDYLLELNQTVRYESRRLNRDDEVAESPAGRNMFRGDSVDYLGLLTVNGREKVVRNLIRAQGVDFECQGSRICLKISAALEELFSTNALQEWERALCAAAVLIVYVLEERNKTVGDLELSAMEARPWLRHLWWDGCLAYVLWDIIPILERLDAYDTAVLALETLLFGETRLVIANDAPVLVERTTRLAPLLLSRRARGKAYDRIIIDMTHASKRANLDMDDKAKKVASKSYTARLSQYCESVLGRAVHSCSLSFSAIRGLARRLKRPLAETMRSLPSFEAQELGMRLENADGENDTDDAKQGYSDWTPQTDFAIANAVQGVDSGVGSRCVFVGHQDSSLNVEELALECYRTGKFPSGDDSDNGIAGGWEGWHDEGGNIRAVFRIICGGPLLGMDWGCAYETLEGESKTRNGLLHLSPYQGAPFDLHVGFELCKFGDDTPSRPTNGFYAGRQDRICLFLQKLASLSRQEVCDLVYESVESRLIYSVETGIKDPSLDRDLRNLRTISLIASGCGGQQLAAIFRCFMFDYRHFSGGLPDLLLVRALSRDADGAHHLVDLSDWTGESFGVDFQLQMQNRRGATMLADEEFLACSKVGDSGGTQFGASRRTLPTQSATGSTALYTLEDLPDPLELEHNGIAVFPECMMVEVKSTNDRLDPRQEDWLNVLDKYGSARVCKFEDSKKAKRRAGKSAKPVQQAMEPLAC